MHSNMSQDKYVIVKGSGGGGLGDRLWSVLVASLYCYLTNRLLHVDWSDGLLAPKGYNPFYSLFDSMGQIRVSKKFPIIADQLDVIPKAWRYRTERSLDEIYKEDGHKEWNRMKMVKQYSFDLSDLDYQESFLFMWEFDQYNSIKSYLPTMLNVGDRESVFRWIFKNNFSVVRELEDSASGVVPNPDSTIAVHMRLTEESIKQKGKIYLRQYFQKIEEIRRENDITNIFLATDNTDLIKSFRKKYDNVITREKWMGEAGQSIHLNTACPDRLRSTKDAMIELSLLSKCAFLLTQDNSAFSSIARIMSNTKTENIISLQSNYNLHSGLKNFIKTFNF